MTTFEIHGLSPLPIAFLRTQLHGDKNKLIEHPESAKIYIRFSTPKRSKPKDTWTVFKGHLFPCPTVPSPTLFRDQVFKTVHHAFTACLLWYHGGLSTTFQYEFYPSDASFPLLRVTKGVASLGIPGLEDSVLVVHHLHVEPTHSQLLSFGEELRRQNYKTCMLLIGSVTPKKFNPRLEPPPLRGILLYADFLRPSGGDDGDAFPVGAVQHGWIPCVGGDKMTLQFCMHGQDEKHSMPPVSLSPLNNYEQRLWKRQDGAFCIQAKTALVDQDMWNEKINGDRQIPSDS